MCKHYKIKFASLVVDIIMISNSFTNKYINAYIYPVAKNKAALPFVKMYNFLLKCVQFQYEFNVYYIKIFTYECNWKKSENLWDLFNNTTRRISVLM